MSFNSKSFLALAAIGGVLTAGVPALAGPPVSAGKIRYDFNGDGKSDVLFEKIAAPNIGLLRISLVDGSAFTGSTFPLTLTTGQEASGAGDFNNATTRTEILARKTVAPNLGSLRITELNADASAPTGSAFPVAPPADFHLIGIGDFDADGIDDLAYYKTAAPNQGLIRVILMNANLTVKTSAFPATMPAGFVGAAVGDVDGDGHADIIAVKTTTPNLGLVRAFIMADSGTTVESSQFPMSVPSGFTLRGVAPANNDDRADYILEKTAAPNVGLVRIAMSGTGGSSIASNAFPLTLAAGFNIQQIGNYDGTNHNDLLARKTTAPNLGLIRIVLLNADATAPLSSGFPASLDPAAFRIVDDTDPI